MTKHKQKLKTPNLSHLRFSWCDHVKDSIKDIEKLGYTVSIEYEKNKDKKDDLIKGFYIVKLNGSYITCLALPYEKFDKFLRLNDKLETIYRTLFYVKNQC